jgi:beta-lactamase class A
MGSARRSVAGVAVAVLAALVVFFALRGHGAGHPFGLPASAAPATGSAVTKQALGTPSPPGSSGGARPASPQGRASVPAAVNPVSADTAAEQHADPLSGAAAAYLAGRSGTVLAAVYDVKTGQTWRLGTGAAQDEASVVKLNVLEALLAQQDGGPLTPADQDLAQSMIEQSDNSAATSLWYEAGGAEGIGAYNGRAGLTGTTPSPCVSCAGFPWPGWGLTTTVPQDQLALLKQLVVPGRNPLLSAAQRSYALSLMENVTADQAWGVSGGVPAGVTVALKNGWLPLNDANTDWQVNSVGWISGDGRDYLLAVLSTGNPTEQYGIDTINGMSSLVWSAMR